jgi:hypothetical protein
LRSHSGRVIELRVRLRKVGEHLGEFAACLRGGDPLRAFAVFADIQPADAHVLAECPQSGLTVKVADPQLR